jgi:hypothetical protein
VAPTHPVAAVLSLQLLPNVDDAVGVGHRSLGLLHHHVAASVGPLLVALLLPPLQQALLKGLQCETGVDVYPSEFMSCHMMMMTYSTI